jgi:hypothetical protein
MIALFTKCGRGWSASGNESHNSEWAMGQQREFGPPIEVRRAESNLLGTPPHGFGFGPCGGGRIYVSQFVPCQRGNDALLFAADEVRV